MEMIHWLTSTSTWTLASLMSFLCIHSLLPTREGGGTLGSAQLFNAHPILFPMDMSFNIQTFRLLWNLFSSALLSRWVVTFFRSSPNWVFVLHWLVMKSRLKFLLFVSETFLCSYRQHHPTFQTKLNPIQKGTILHYMLLYEIQEWTPFIPESFCCDCEIDSFFENIRKKLLSPLYRTKNLQNFWNE